jgi:Holliday junction resolvasome RuvABC endonuclease subunit
MPRLPTLQPPLLAIDLATKSGFALLLADGTITSGVVSFKVGAREGDGMRYVKFWRWLEAMRQAHPDLHAIAYEAVLRHGANQVYAAHCFGGLLATLQAFGELHGIPYRGISVSTIKRQFAGSGRAQKCDVIEQCRAMGFDPADDNEADALALLHVATDTCALLTPCGATPKRRRLKPELAPGADPS